MHHHAEMHNATLYKHENSSWLEGRIYNDTHTHGNHPFRDGTPVTTTAVMDEVLEAGNTYMITRNTTYKMVGVVREVDL